ncbi:MAG: hypothetical protein DRQ63_12000 [Gammaproteobacteria bacterium]|nr:MAG: hypothetical protein DRQ63_12000 [Gammaproteobacteria bacterium]
MKQIFGWMAAKLSRSSTDNPADAPGSPEVSPPDKDDLGLPKDMQDLVDDATLPHVQAGEHDITIPNLSLDDQTSSDSKASIGFNPYDTAKLHEK